MKAVIWGCRRAGPTRAVVVADARLGCGHGAHPAGFASELRDLADRLATILGEPACRDAALLALAALAVFRTRLRAPQIALCMARAIALGGDGAPAEKTFAAAGAARLAMDSGRAVGSMAP